MKEGFQFSRPVLLDLLDGFLTEKTIVGQYRPYLSSFFWNGGHRRDQLLLVIGRLAHSLPHNQPTVHLHGRLGIKALFKMLAVARLHDPAFRIREIVLFFW